MELPMKAQGQLFVMGVGVTMSFTLLAAVTTHFDVYGR